MVNAKDAYGIASEFLPEHGAHTNTRAGKKHVEAREMERPSEVDAMWN